MTISPPPPRHFAVSRLSLPLGLACLVLALSGCETAQTVPPVAVGKAPEALTIAEGDVLKISFPGAPNLDTEQQVRRDGRITLGVLGEKVVLGLTPQQLEQNLLRDYAGQLVTKEVTVTVVSSKFTVFVSGAVVRPGKVVVDHPLTALEAVMEAGGFETARADMKNVVIVRQVEGRTSNFSVNLKLVLEGRSGTPFYLKQSDIVFVPERFSWF